VNVAWRNVTNVHRTVTSRPTLFITIHVLQIGPELMKSGERMSTKATKDAKASRAVQCRMMQSVRFIKVSHFSRHRVGRFTKANLFASTEETKSDTTKASNIGIKWSKLTQNKTTEMVKLNTHKKTKCKLKPTCKFKNCSHVHVCTIAAHYTRHRTFLNTFLPNLQT